MVHSTLLAAVSFFLAPAPTGIIPLHLHASEANLSWHADLSQYTATERLSDYRVLIGLPEDDEAALTVRLQRRKAILLEKHYAAGSRTARPVAIPIGRFLTLPDNDLTLSVQATLPLIDGQAPAALLLSKQDPLFNQKNRPPSFLIFIQDPDRKLITHVDRFRLSPTWAVAALVAVPLTMLAYIRLKFTRRRVVRHRLAK